MRFRDKRQERRLRTYVARHGGAKGKAILANPEAFVALQESLNTPAVKRRVGAKRAEGEGGFLSKLFDLFAKNPGSFLAFLEAILKIFSGMGGV